MADYDLTNLPHPVQEALLHLTDTLVQVWAPGATPAVVAPRTEPSTLDEAEAILHDAQTLAAEAFPRSPFELRILHAVQGLHPHPVTARQIAVMVGLPHGQTGRVLQALATLGALERVEDAKGLYRLAFAPEGALSPPHAPRRRDPTSEQAPALAALPLDDQVLQAFQRAAPMALTPRQIATLVACPYTIAAQTCRHLAWSTQQLSEPYPGHYCYRPSTRQADDA